MAVDLTTGSYDEAGVFSKYNEIVSKPVEESKHVETCSLKNFRVLKVLKECNHTKSVVVEGRFPGDERPAIITVEKMPFDTRDIQKLLSSCTRLELKLRNNIYATYHAYPQNGFNGIGIQVIHPAKEEDFSKFVDQPIVMVKETRELYESIILPYLKNSSQENKDLLKNDEKTLLTESNEEYSFVLLKDDLEKCLCSSTHVRARAYFLLPKLLSMRDLTPPLIPLLKEIQIKCLEELKTKFNIPSGKFESYICYPPSLFPLHIVFETVEKDSRIPAEKAHHLETVITNLQLIPDYYQRATLTYSVPDNDPLLKKIGEYKNGSMSNE